MLAAPREVRAGQSREGAYDEHPGPGENPRVPPPPPMAEVWRQRSGGDQFSVDLAAASTGSRALATIPRAAVSLRYGSDRIVKFCAENQGQREEVSIHI